MEQEPTPFAFELARLVAGACDEETILSRAVSFLVTTSKTADAGILWLYDPPAGRLVARAAHGHASEILRQMRLSPGESLSGKSFQTGQAALYATSAEVAAAMQEIAAANRELYAASSGGHSQPASAMCAPLRAGKTTLGVLTLESFDPANRFDTGDLTFLQYAADLLALAVQNSRLQDALQASQALAESNRTKAESLSFLAHEMRTPLTSIRGYATALLLEEATYSPETQREFLELIEDECETLVNLIHDLLESSSIDAGSLQLEPQPVLLHHLAKEVVDEIGRHTRQHRFLVEFPPSFPVVEADPDRIAQVMRNLLDNAVKYSPQGGLIVVHGEVRPDEVLLSVADQGIGIAPEHLNRLFEKFFRVKSGPNRGTVGSGLGLPIARSIMESHGGRIWAESQLGQGSTFYFTLPFRSDHARSDGELEREHQNE